MKEPAMPSEKSIDQQHDKTLEDSFPASDPPANTGITGAEPPNKPSDERNEAEIPTGLPTSDRHGAETAHQWEHEEGTTGRS
jgi:hypothetical protein